ncbi:MAG: cytochrome C [Burkholderiaceae bacterium]|nr:MAG: cytochrome C [Burkholderiaceae bacterium]
MKRRFAALLVALLPLPALAAPPEPPSPTRGELLYTTHCIACHTTQMHWRDQRLATDWAGLQAQVRRWQGVAKLGWTDDDILEVTRHLNDRIYRFAPSGDKVTSMLRASSIGH